MRNKYRASYYAEKLSLPHLHIAISMHFAFPDDTRTICTIYVQQGSKLDLPKVLIGNIGRYVTGGTG